MEITLHGKPLGKVEDLKVGEHGFVPTAAYGRAELPSFTGRNRPDNLAPVMLPPMGDCYRVTRTDETLDVEFVPAVGHLSVAMDEIVVVDSATHLFQRHIRELQKEGWRVDTGSLYITHGADAFMALLHREAQGE